jgi:hypothetical protein
MQRVEFENSNGETWHGTVLREEEYTSERDTWEMNKGATYELVVIAVEELDGAELRVVKNLVRFPIYPKVEEEVSGRTQHTLGDYLG